jgi:hypothetical protein
MTTPMNQCGACGLDFSSVSGFDKHRVGKHAYLYAEGLRMNPPREDGRRCLSVSELEAAGMAQDARGRWGLVKDRERIRRAFSGSNAVNSGIETEEPER